MYWRILGDISLFFAGFKTEKYFKIFSMAGDRYADELKFL